MFEPLKMLWSSTWLSIVLNVVCSSVLGLGVVEPKRLLRAISQNDASRSPTGFSQSSGIPRKQTVWVKPNPALIQKFWKSKYEQSSSPSESSDQGKFNSSEKIVSQSSGIPRKQTVWLKPNPDLIQKFRESKNEQSLGP